MLNPNPPSFSTGALLLGLAGWLAISFPAAGIGMIASADAKSFYAQLIRPQWAPPAWVFGPVWTTLYILMGVAAWLVWREIGFALRAALIVFLAQLALNALWSWMFFRVRSGPLSAANIVLLWILIVATVCLFWRISLWAGVLLLPYLLWVTFACALNFAIWRLNVGKLD